MKKKIAISFIVLFAILVGTTVLVFAGFPQETAYEVDETGVMCSLKTYDSTASGKIEIPKDYNGIMVTGISENAFLKCPDVTEVIVPKTVVNIGEFSLGYIVNEAGEKVLKENFVIWGRADSEAQKYAEKNGVSFKVYLTTPPLVSVKTTVGGVEVRWTPTDNAEGYNIYRKTQKSKWKKIDFASGENTNYFMDTTVKNSTEYIYTVRAANDESLSGYDKNGLSTYFLTTPIVTLKNTKNGVNISWTKNNNATSYRVYKKVDGTNKWVRLKTVKSSVLSYVDKTATSSQKALYCVRAVENENLSSFETNKSIIFLSEPTVSAAKNSTKGIKIYWNKISGAQKYRIYRKVNGSKWAKIAEVSSKNITYTDKNVKAGTKYDYTVRAIAENHLSSYNKGAATYCVNHPVLKSVSPATNGLKISWNKVAKADNYSVYRKNAEGKWVKIHTTKNNSTLSYTDKSLASGNNYTYTVVAWYKKAKSGYDTNGLTGKYFASPILNSARCIKSKNITLGWSGVDGADYYLIYKKEVGGKYSVLATVNSDVTSYTDTAISIGKEYAYVIKAKTYAGLVSGNSNTKTVRVLDPSKPMVALTYDDGPSNSATTRILDVLEKNNARATFFVVGSRVDSYKSQLQRAYKLNCEIGNHTYNHKTLTSLSANNVKSELSNTDKKIKAITGENPVLMRPPGGSYKNGTVKNNTAYPIIMWSVDTRDWENRNASKIVSNIKSNVGDGSIVLMHDLYDSTAAATETIVPWLIGQGYQLVTVSEMMDAKGIEMKNGVAYYSAK